MNKKEKTNYLKNTRSISTRHNPFVTAKDSTSGITLIALVVTIIVLIILAGISISLILGENGIIQKALQSKEQTIVSQEKEQVEMSYSAAKIGKEGGTVTDSELQKELNKTVGEAKTTVETNEDGSLTVVFKENKHAYRINNGKIEETKYIEYVDFEVTSSNYTMMGITTLEGDIVIPQTFVYDGVNYKVTSIGEEAFSGCDEITSITIPNGVTSIGNSAFAECYEITSITLPNSLISIGESAFYDCDELTKITIPDSVTTMGERTFEGCNNLANITLSNSLTSIEYETFYECESLISITIPDSVTTIKDYAFECCHNLTNITLSNSLVSIGESAFYDCYESLTEIIIPKSVTEIASDAFDECNNLKTIMLKYGTSLEISDEQWGAENAIVVIIGEETRADFFLFNEETGNIYLLAEDTSENHDGIGYYYNDSDEKIISEEYVVIPSTINGVEVTGINGEIYVGGGEYLQAFPSSSNLKTIVIPDTVTEISEFEFSDCTNLQYVKLSNKLTKIENWTFNGCVSLKRITIPESVTEIDSWAFNDCTSLTEITIPKSVTTIDEYAFDGCTNLKKIIIEEGSTLKVPESKWGATNATIK